MCKLSCQAGTPHDENLGKEKVVRGDTSKPRVRNKSFMLVPLVWFTLEKLEGRLQLCWQLFLAYRLGTGVAYTSISYALSPR